MNVYFAKFIKALHIINKEGISTFLKLLKVKLFKNNDAMFNIEESNFNSSSNTLFLRRLSFSQLSKFLHRRMQYNTFILSLSHNNYTKSVGGVQLKINDEQVAANKSGVGYLHIYPRFSRPTLVFGDEPFFLGINLDGKTIGYIEGNFLLQALKTMSEKNLLEIRIHHTMGYSNEFVQKLLLEIKRERVRFWLHDFFSICPSYFLLRNNLEYCHAPQIDSNSCQICVYFEIRRRQQEVFNQLFYDNIIEVVAPSDFALSLWKDKFPSKKYTSIVIPNADLIWTDEVQSTKSEDILRIAFIGYPVFHKGWPVWLKITEALKNHHRFQFYLFSSDRSRNKNFRQVRISVTNKNRFEMVKALKDNKIDIAFLWSICPETFSFTLYESLAADCYILTGKDSGNIQDYISRNPRYGLVLKNEKELWDLFYNGEIFTRLSSYKARNRLKANIIFSE